jgi:hypothetical protein
MPANAEMALTAEPAVPEASAPNRTERRKSPKRTPVHLSGTNVPDCACQLVGIDAGILYLRSDRQIAESSSVMVSFDHVQLSGVVAGCQADERHWVISIALASCKRRLDGRVPAGEKSVIGIVESNGTTLRAGRVIDQSQSGLGLRLDEPMDPGARICVETETMMVFGEVRYCRPTLDGQFVAGVMIVEVVPDVHSQNAFSVMLNNLRWKLASSIRGKDVPVYRPDR